MNPLEDGPTLLVKVSPWSVNHVLLLNCIHKNKNKSMKKSVSRWDEGERCVTSWGVSVTTLNVSSQKLVVFHLLYLLAKIWVLGAQVVECLERMPHTQPTQVRFWTEVLYCMSHPTLFLTYFLSLYCLIKVSMPEKILKTAQGSITNQKLVNTFMLH